jgi:hypothetical protein
VQSGHSTEGRSERKLKASKKRIANPKSLSGSFSPSGSIIGIAGPGAYI